MAVSAYPKEWLEEAARGARTLSEALERLGIDPKSSTRHYIRERMKKLGVDTSHFEREGVGGRGRPWKPRFRHQRTCARYCAVSGLRSSAGSTRTSAAGSRRTASTPRTSRSRLIGARRCVAELRANYSSSSPQTMPGASRAIVSGGR